MSVLKIDDFMNPLKGNAAFNLKSVIQTYRSDYFEKISKELLVSCVYNKHRESYTFFFKIPSSHNDKYPTAIMYDTIIEFKCPKGTNKKTAAELASIETYDIFIFSNSPGFMFTFDYVIKTKYGFPSCVPSSYLSKTAIYQPPVKRNMFEIMTIEKTTWYSVFHLHYNGYLNKDRIKTILSDKSEGYFLKTVAPQLTKLNEIRTLEKTMSIEKARAKANNNKNIGRSYHKADDPLKANFKSNMYVGAENTNLKSIFNRNSGLFQKMKQTFKFR